MALDEIGRGLKLSTVDDNEFQEHLKELRLQRIVEDRSRFLFFHDRTNNDFLAYIKELRLRIRVRRDGLRYFIKPLYDYFLGEIIFPERIESLGRR